MLEGVEVLDELRDNAATDAIRANRSVLTVTHGYRDTAGMELVLL